MLADVPEYLAHHGLNAESLSVLNEHGRLNPSLEDSRQRELIKDEGSK